MSQHILLRASIPYSQFLRMRRNCTEWDDFVGNSIKLTMYLLQRGYPCKLIHDNLVAVNKLERKDLLYGQEKPLK